MKQVTVVQRRMTHYRVPFFEALRSSLAIRGIELTLAYGVGTAAEQEKGDGADVVWARRLPTSYGLGGRLCWQPLTAVTQHADMLVVTLENKLLANLLYQYGHPMLRVGLWGHGANLQGDPSSWRERFKLKVAKRADWWFGYTEMSRSLIAHSGFPDERVTVLNNAVDTSAMRQQFDAVSHSDRLNWRLSHGVGADVPVGIFVGSLYEEKRLDFLLSAAKRVREVLSDFQLFIIGAGPERGKVDAFARQHGWVHALGLQKGHEKITALAAADVMLNPGLVGLGILDSFVCEVPMVTTDCGLHSPEIAYLSVGVNGEMTANTEAAFVSKVVRVLSDPFYRMRLRRGCAESAQRYTVANMATNFAQGVASCLDASIIRGRR